MDVYLAAISMRVVRQYSDRPLAEDSLRRILQAGRATGSSQNRQPWKFYVIRDPTQRAALAPAVYAPHNVRDCQAAIAVTTTSKSNFDVGRVFQNMALAAWSERIGSAPNSVRNPELAASVLGSGENEHPGTILSLGFPLHPWTPRPDDVDGILRRINRKPLDELVVWLS
jgi:nitroreductase